MIDAKGLKNTALEEFADALAGSDPVPGGGGVSAYAAALGAALGSMVCSLTTGKKKYAETQGELDEIIPKLEAYRRRFIDGIKEDADSFLPLAKAYSLPEATPEEKAHKEEVMEELLLKAAETPLSLMCDISECLVLLERLAEIGSRLAMSDVGVGAAMCRAAMDSASLNVFINTKYMKNREKAASLNDEATELVSGAQVLSEDILKQVRGALEG